jgi:hypothetical protein
MRETVSHRSRCTRRFLALALALIASWSGRAAAVMPDGPEVKAVLDKAFKFLDTADDKRLGARCLVGLCFVKRGERESHPQVKAAVEACQSFKAGNPEGKQVGNEYVYSAGLAVVFLCELNPSKYQAEIHYYLTSLQAVQRPYGGWGYPLDNKDFGKTADTSMTQYGVLASWEAKRHGFVVPIDSIERVCGWLMRTQDPSGGWSYQGTDPGNESSSEVRLVKQDKNKVRQGLSAAGLGSVYICADLLGLVTLPKFDDEDANLPPALKPVRDVGDQKPLTQKISAKAVRATQERGLGWWGGHFKVDVPDFPFYYLYALERFRSFHELATGQHPREPGWYTDGFQYLRRKQKEDGSWEKGCGPAADTAFAALFLMRSTKRSIEKTQGYDAGMLAGGQGLPPKLAEVHLRDGRIVNKPVAGSLPALLVILAHPDHPDFAGLSDDPRNIVSALEEEQGAAREEHLALVRQLAAHGSTASRLAAVRVLAKLRDMNNAPALIAALSDREWPIVYTADQGLRFLSRRVGLKTVTELPDETARDATIAEWKHWYAGVSPGTAEAP